MTKSKTLITLVVIAVFVTIVIVAIGGGIFAAYHVDWAKSRPKQIDLAKSGYKSSPLLSDDGICTLLGGQYDTTEKKCVCGKNAMRIDGPLNGTDSAAVPMDVCGCVNTTFFTPAVDSSNGGASLYCAFSIVPRSGSKDANLAPVASSAKTDAGS